jgi:hypothetical protein
MRHASSRALYDYWNTRRGKHPAPERGDIDPAAIRHILADTFVLHIDPIVQSRFRLAGKRVCALFGREITNEPFLQIWSTESRVAVQGALTTVSEDLSCIVGSAIGVSQAGDRIDLELLLLPLRTKGRAQTSALGVLAPLSATYWLGTHPLATLRFGNTRQIGASAAIGTQAPRTTTTASGRQMGGFVVYDGGRHVQPADTSVPPAL